jgi:hypothetical protein
MNAEALAQFAKNARLTPEERADVDGVARRYILAHIDTNGEDALAHAYVGNDYEAMRLRMRAPTLHACKSGANDIDPATFLNYVERAHREPPESSSSERAPGFLAFEHVAFPRPRGEERYRYVTRPNRWRECAAYLMLGMRTKPSFGAMARTLNVDASALARYPLPATYAREVGQLLADMALPGDSAEWIPE